MREVARILNESNLGEVSLETAPGARLSLKRAVYVAPVALPPTLAEVEALEEAQTLAIAEEAQAVADARVEILAPAVGVFRAARSPIKVGDEVGKRALLGAVETLNIPTELYAAGSARVTEVLVADGQGVEWGQPLLVLEPLEK